MLSRIPTWGRLHWAPRSMRCTILSTNGNPLVELTPQSAEGRHQFGDWATLMKEAPALLASLREVVDRYAPSAAPANDEIAAMWARARTAIAKATGADES